MENDIIAISDHIEIHPNGDRYSVVRDGSVYGTYEDLDYAREVAEELAEQETKATRNTDAGMRYDWPAIEAAARKHGIEPDALKDWTFDGVTDELTADQIAQAYLDEQEARS